MCDRGDAKGNDHDPTSEKATDAREGDRSATAKRNQRCHSEAAHRGEQRGGERTRRRIATTDTQDGQRRTIACCSERLRSVTCDFETLSPRRIMQQNSDCTAISRVVRGDQTIHRRIRLQLATFMEFADLSLAIVAVVTLLYSALRLCVLRASCRAVESRCHPTTVPQLRDCDSLAHQWWL